jgi:alpha-galactosidase
LKLAELGLPAQHTFAASDVLRENAPVPLAGGAVRIDNQVPESVRVIKLIDTSIAPGVPSVEMHVDKVGDTFQMSAQTASKGVPAIGYRWDFGDGTGASGPRVSHAYTRAGQFTIRLTVEGLDGVAAAQTFFVNAGSHLRAFPSLRDNRRYVDPADH